MASIIKANQLQDFGGNSIITSDGAGNVTVNAAAMKNTPAFEAYLSSTQSVSDGVTTKVNIDTENFDTNNNFASSRFTPTVAGKYFVYGSVVGYAGAVTDLVANQAMIYKNGSYYAGGETNYNGNFIQRGYDTVSTIVEMNGSSDYVELYGYVNGNSGGGEFFYVQAGLAKCNLFGAYKLIGA